LTGNANEKRRNLSAEGQQLRERWLRSTGRDNRRCEISWRRHIVNTTAPVIASAVAGASSHAGKIALASHRGTSDNRQRGREILKGFSAGKAIRNPGHNHQSTITDNVSMSDGSHTQVSYDAFGNVTGVSFKDESGLTIEVSNAPPAPSK
jgi:hypothetical protein